LIVGGLLFVVGIVIAAIRAVQSVNIFLQENTIINQVSIELGNNKINNSGNKCLKTCYCSHPY
jgi:hypothetical protein